VTSQELWETSSASVRINCASSGPLLALLHKARLRRAGELLAVLTHSLGLARVALAFLQEAVLRVAGKCLTILVHCLALAGFLRQRGADGEGRQEGNQHHSFHGLSPS